MEIVKGGKEWRMLSNWMAHNGLYEPCCQLHPTSSCAKEIGLKFVMVARNNNMLYIAIHFIPFLLFKLRKLKGKSKKEIWAAVLKLFKKYFGSILFMSTFVSTYRAILCFRGNVGTSQINIVIWLIIAAVVASASLFMQQFSRRKQVALYAFVRSIPTIYNIFSRRGYIKIPHVEKLLFVTLFGVLSLCYHEYKSHLTYSSIFQKIWSNH